MMILTSRERAAALCLEAVQRGLWDVHTALGFMAYCADDLLRVEHWETKLIDIVEGEKEQLEADKAVKEAQKWAAQAFHRTENSINRFDEPEIQLGAITTGRTIKFGIDEQVLP